MNRYYLNRTLCDVLEEMRACWKTRNFAPMFGLIEEAQSMGNRMEAALGSMKDIERMHEEFLELRKEYKQLQSDIDTLRRHKEALENDDQAAVAHR